MVMLVEFNVDGGNSSLISSLTYVATKEVLE